jgi:hypothetical protein
MFQVLVESTVACIRVAVQNDDLYGWPPLSDPSSGGMGEPGAHPAGLGYFRAMIQIACISPGM